MFRAIKPTKNADPGKYKCSAYSKEFDSHSEFLFTDGSIGKMSLFFGADMGSSVHTDNKGTNIFILGEGPTKRLDEIMLTAEIQYSINFPRSNRKFCLILHYNESSSFLFVNTTKICQSKANDTEIKKYVLCLGNASKDFTANSMNKTGLRIKRIFLQIFCWL